MIPSSGGIKVKGRASCMYNFHFFIAPNTFSENVGIVNINTPIVSASSRDEANHRVTETRRIENNLYSVSQSLVHPH